MARVPVEPVFPNTTMEKYINSSGVERAYIIYPVEGYVLHNNARDWTDEDGNLQLGYSTSSSSVPINYDFETNPDDIYAVLESEVPADHIFGTTNPVS